MYITYTNIFFNSTNSKSKNTFQVECESTILKGRVIRKKGTHNLKIEFHNSVEGVIVRVLSDKK